LKSPLSSLNALVYIYCIDYLYRAVKVML
jgi:hypothetical protein